jgi:hypothetical protein
MLNDEGVLIGRFKVRRLMSELGLTCKQPGPRAYKQAMDGATVTATAQGFSAALNQVPLKMRQTFTYDQGRELVSQAQITQGTDTAIYFADPHSPWQRAINENTKELLRQYMPKGTDLSVLSQNDLDAIVIQLNTRPRKRLGFKAPLEVFMDLIKRTQSVPAGVHKPSVALGVGDRPVMGSNNFTKGIVKSFSKCCSKAFLKRNTQAREPFIDFYCGHRKRFFKHGICARFDHY